MPSNPATYRIHLQAPAQKAEILAQLYGIDDTTADEIARVLRDMIIDSGSDSTGMHIVISRGRKPIRALSVERGTLADSELPTAPAGDEDE